MNACLAGACLSTNKLTTQSGTVGTYESSFAVDGDPCTFSGAQDRGAHPWWIVDLEEEYDVADVGSVDIIFPGTNCCDNRNYRQSSFIY